MKKTASVTDIRSSRAEDSLPDQVIKGLKSDPKTLPALLFYSDEGLGHWNHHASQPDFYPRRQEIDILKQRGDEMAGSIAANSVVVDLGSANLEKVTHLLKAVEAQEKPVDYFALDVAAPQLTSTLEAMIATTRFRHVGLGGLHGTFDDGLRWLEDTPTIEDRPRCVLLLGLTIGNFSRRNAAAFLRSIANHALRGPAAESSSILVSIDSCKMPTQILRAYTSEGVVPFALQSLTCARRLLLGRGDDDDDAALLSRHLNPDDWYYHSEWNFVLGRHEASLIPRSRDLPLGPLLDNVTVQRDEKVRFGCSYKYDESERETLFSDAGLRCEAVWTNQGCHVAIYQLKLAASL
uniref:4-dimethylallyltryptophan N-methyltransferase n=1 Tax=Claviceps paspali TaxID=40601 RepID=G8GV77_CLAPA|nr:dimethylallyltryptophan N-methyltransferase [Claviceps paspali]